MSTSRVVKDGAWTPIDVTADDAADSYEHTRNAIIPRSPYSRPACPKGRMAAIIAMKAVVLAQALRYDEGIRGAGGPPTALLCGVSTDKVSSVLSVLD